MSELTTMLNHQANIHKKQGAIALGELFENAASEIDNLTNLLNDIKTDLLERADLDSSDCKVVNLGSTNWSKLKELVDNE
jgi:hypothetical protein